MSEQPQHSKNTSAWTARLDADDLERSNLPDAPLALFSLWFEQARGAGLIEPTAASLATVDERAQPSARTVLVKHFDDAGFYFYSNYSSRKGVELAANPQAALLFWWDKLERQVRIEGTAEKLEAALSDQYFSSRPRGSQISAQASPQSRVIASRDDLKNSVAELEAYYEDREIPRPQNWGGYRLRPQRIEFWQGRRNRLHDRVCYQRMASQWHWSRLAP